ncbi:MAG: SDR family oxidoreductase [Planctomycetaceae bacterium]|nr:SDR family oxidoreductase [Planctomycetaceae bacterium]MBT6483382.1 SDR family oxidoreductase [Planctomycetaceae bacterium]MBT6493823.1 SDR family oxidoreductase [Planctomycetaceae bacterium]
MIELYADRWALITGASSGIGAEFARRLAGRGMHLVLVARRETVLAELAEELHTRHGTKCELIVGDLSEPDQAGRVIDRVNELGVTIELLVNNAGYGIVGTVEQVDAERVMSMLRLNVGTLTELTYGILPGMVERGHGAIINVASVAAFQPVAYMPAYSATKAYVLHFSEALWAEVYDRGVTIMALCPGVTRTGFFDVAGVPNWLKKQSSHTPAQVVKRAMKALEKRRQFVVPGWSNYLRALATRLAPRRFVVRESMKYFRPKKKKNATKSTDADAPPTGDDAPSV